MFWALHADSLPLAYALFFVAMLLLFVNTSPVNALTVSSLPASARATGTALNVLLIHLFGDAISPEWVGRPQQRRRSAASPAEALAHGLEIAVPAVMSRAWCCSSRGVAPGAAPGARRRSAAGRSSVDAGHSGRPAVSSSSSRRVTSEVVSFSSRLRS